RVNFPARDLADDAHGGHEHQAILPGESRTIFFSGFRSRLRLKPPGRAPPCSRLQPEPTFCVKEVGFLSEFWMPYALFCNEAKLSNAYPTEADVWKLARESGLVVEVVSGDDQSGPRPILENDYEIRP